MGPIPSTLTSSAPGTGGRGQEGATGAWGQGRAGAGEGKVAYHLAETWGCGKFSWVPSAAEPTAISPGPCFGSGAGDSLRRLIGQQTNPKASLLPVQRLEGARPGGGCGGWAGEMGLLRKPETPKAPRGQIRSPSSRGQAGLGGVGVEAACSHTHLK